MGSTEYFALAPPGYLHLERAVFEIAYKIGPHLWPDRVTEAQYYDRIGSDFHFLRETAPDSEQADSYRRTSSIARQALREGELISVFQRRDTGGVFALARNAWAQENAPIWFTDGELFVPDPTISTIDFAPLIGPASTRQDLDLMLSARGVLADIFIEGKSLAAFLGSTAAAGVGDRSQAKSPRSQKRSRMTRGDLIEGVLRAAYPNGPPDYIDRKAMAEKVRVQLGDGRPVSLISLDRARRTLWG